MSDRLALCALVGAVPPTMVDDAVLAAGVGAQRVRTLPPWVTTYHVLGSAMSPRATYDDVTDLVWTTLPAATGRGLSRQRPTRGAITRARSRLGADPLAALLSRMAPAAPEVEPISTVYLHRFQAVGVPGLWWITCPDTGALRGCDARDDSLDTAVRLLRSAGVSHVTVDLPVGVGASLQQQLGADVRIETGRSTAADGAWWLGLRARTSAGWRQEALARACVIAAWERASRIAQSLS
ncbi:transposase domain-containing protein [Mycobacterium sp. ZZG]